MGVHKCVFSAENKALIMLVKEQFKSMDRMASQKTWEIKEDKLHDLSNTVFKNVR